MKTEARRLRLALALAGWCASAAWATSPALGDETTSVRAQMAWQEARALSDQKRFADALATLERALADEPGRFDLLWLQAGVTGWSGRHHESVALYRKLMAAHPDRARDLRTDLADELADADRLDQALSEFARAQAEDSSNTRARLGYARTLNWSGRHREAARAYRQLLAKGVDDPEVYDGLAHAEYWAGRTDRARSALTSLLERQGADPEAASLDAALRRESRPTLTTGYEGSSDSDDLTLGTWSAEYRAPLGSRDALLLTWRGDRVEDAGGGYDLGRAGLGHVRLWSDVVETHAYGSWQYRGPAGDRRFVGDGWATLRPTDALRLDLGLGREQVRTRRALDLTMLYWTGSASVDWQATPRWSAHGSHRENFYADRNRSWLSGAEFDYRFASRRSAAWTSGMEFQHLAAESDPDNGYYAPRSYVEIGPRFAVSAEPSPGWSVDAAFRAGREREARGLWNTYYGLEASLVAPLGRSASVALQGARTDSHLGSEAGFERTAGAAYLIVRF